MNNTQKTILTIIYQSIPRLSAWSSIAVWAILLFLFTAHPEPFEAVLFFPLWIWSIPGFVLAIPLFFSNRGKFGTGLILFGIAFLCIYQEEPKSMARSLFVSQPVQNWEEMHEKGEAVRIVSFNCANRDIESLIEIKHMKPDIILLQESVLPDRIEVLQKEVFGEDASDCRGGDSTIIANGTVHPSKEFPSHLHFFMPTRIHLRSGVELEAISLHLQVPETRTDFWSPSCWRSHRNSRTRQQKQILEIIAYIQSIPKDIPIIVGGDFNVPANNRILWPLKNRLQDCFAIAGIGWGNTMMNDYPVMRFDQIWASAHFQPRVVTARKSKKSDHRMVICDMIVNN